MSCKNQKLNTPFPSNRKFKKLQVCGDVKDNFGNIKNIHFGDNRYEDFTQHKNKERRSNFRARHNCPEKKDKTTAGYWACKELW